MLEPRRHVAEGQAAHAVVEAAGGPPDEGGGAGRLHGFEGAAGAEAHVGPFVDAQDDGALALFAEDLEMGLVGAGGDFPVHVADVVTLAVLAHFFEVDPGAPKHGGVEPGEGRADQVVRG